MKKYIYALGFFDGVHLGHQALLAEAVKLAAALGLGTAAITFDDHPQAAFTKEYPPLLTTLYDRGALLRRFGMEEAVLLEVNEKVMSTPWEAFLEELCARGAAGFVCGDDFRFGAGGEGDVCKLAAFCRERALPCIIVPEQRLDGIRISSSHIRTLLETGDLAEAERFLGHRYRLTGQVVHGQGLGHTIGIPTANLAVPEKLVLPKKGVYACLARVQGKEYAAVTNIGTRPTVAGKGITVEPWLLDFDGDIYGAYVRLEFCKFLRPEQKFPSLEALTAQVHADMEATKQYFDRLEDAPRA